MSRPILASAILVSLSLTAQAQTTWHIQGNGTPSGAGSVESPFGSIQQGIIAASTGGLVMVLPGTYYERLDYLGKGLEVRGRDGPAVTVIDAQSQGNAILMVSADGPGAVLQGLTIKNGLGAGGFSGNGGGLRCIGGSCTLIDCVFTNNQGPQFGGAIYAGSDLTVWKCTFLQNHATAFGTAVFQESPNTSAAFHDCVFDSNSGALGEGALRLSVASAVIEDCVFRHYVGFDAGATLHLVTPSGVVKRCRFENNQGEFAGGAWVAGNVAFEHCDFLENIVGYGGGAVTVSSYPQGEVTFASCSFAGNRAHTGACARCYGTQPVRFENCTFWAHAGSGTGVTVLEGSILLLNCTLVANVGTLTYGPVELRNSIAWGNVPNAYPSSFISSYSDIQGGWPGVGNIDADPLFVDAPQGDFHLHRASPCRNAGMIMPGLPANDFDNNPRVLEGAPDMEADEWVARLAGTHDDFVLFTSVNGNFAPPAPSSRAPMTSWISGFVRRRARFKAASRSSPLLSIQSRIRSRSLESCRGSGSTSTPLRC